MKIKRFFADDIRQALRQVRETLGPDAVILSNKSVDGGVELVAAMDYDEAAFEQQQRAAEAAAAEEAPVTPIREARGSDGGRTADPRPAPEPARVEWSQDPVLVEMRREMKALRRMMENQLSDMVWHEMGNRRPQTQELLRRLMGLDLTPDLCHRLAERIQDADSLDQAWRKALYQLAAELPVAGEGLIDEGGVVALVGPTGVGKTTTIAKLAARFILRHGHRNLALVTTDSYRIGAREQLNTYARILDVPVRTAASADELRVTLNALSGKRLVLVDTAGMSQRDLRLSDQLSMLHSGSRPVRTFLALSATTQQPAMEQAVKAFGGDSLEGCILTKVDEAASLGGALSAVIHCGIPLAFYTDGQKVPEDIHLARAHTLVSRAVTLAQEAGTEYSDDYLAMALGGLRADAHG